MDEPYSRPPNDSRPATSGAGFLTAREAATELGVDERTVRRAIARGELRAVKRSGVFRISPDDLHRFRAQRGRSRYLRADQIHVAAAGDHGGDVHPHLVLLPLPPPLSLSVPPIPLTSLIGREREITAIAGAFRQGTRFLTLTGPGGVGKTRLALAVADSLGDAFADGVAFVGLGSVTDSDLVAPTIAHDLGVREAGGEPIAARLIAALRDREQLLILDNFEQVVQAAPLISSLLAACPHIQVLVTSRVRLRVTGERERAVPPLGLAARPAPSGEEGGLSEAVKLFADRAQAAHSAFELDAGNIDAVRAICQRLDGLPLAIELAAARVNVMPPAAMLTRLDRWLPVLTGGPRDAPARLQTMRDAIAWSYDLMTRDEQFLFRRLAVFIDGFGLDGARAVGQRPVDNMGSLAGEGDTAVLVTLAALVDKSLLKSDSVPGGEVRYRMLETVREFGLERLAATGEEAGARQRHADWCLAFAEDAGPRAKQSGATLWIDALEREHPNLRAALTWFEHTRDGDRLLRMVGSLWPFWQEHTYFGEGYHWLTVALDLGREAPAAHRLAALTGVGTLAWYQTRLEEARAWHEEALALAREHGDQAAEAFSLINLSAQQIELGDLEAGHTSLETGLELARAIGETEAEGLALHNLACLGWIRGDLAEAKHRAEETLVLARSQGWDWLVPMTLIIYGLTMADQGDLESAGVVLRDGLAQGQVRGNLGDVGTALEGLARVNAASGEARRAVRLFGAAAALRDEIGMLQTPTDRAYYAPFLAELKQELGTLEFVAAWGEGRALDWRNAVAEGFVQPEAVSHNLTRRELEILRLLAAGERNRAISEKLFISPATVASHVANIYGKLGVDTRAKAAAYAHQRGLA